MKTTIEFSDELVAQIERLRARDGVSMRALVDEGLRLAIAARDAKGDYRLQLPVVGGQPMAGVADVNAWVRQANEEWPAWAPLADLPAPDSPGDAAQKP